MNRNGQTARSQVARLKDRASYDWSAMCQVLDAGLMCHVAFQSEGQPYLIPMAYARQGDVILLHGAREGRLMQALASGAEICVAVTHLDGVVFARSQFHHSMNYRSVVLFGRAELIDDADEKSTALAHFVETVSPQRSTQARGPSAGELTATTIVRFTPEEGSLKQRSGPPSDASGDMDYPAWAGVIPMRTEVGDPVPSPDLGPDSPPVPKLRAGLSGDGST